MPVDKVPDIVVGRLPVYLRALNLLAEEGRAVVSSQELGRRLGISSAQIRKDLSHFGEFGKQGTGYEIEYLRQQLARILRIEGVWDVALVGCGALGRALTNYRGFAAKGFQITVVFDNDPGKIGKTVAGKPILDVAQMPAAIHERDIKVAIVAVPSAGAQETVDALVRCGIKAILNYAPINISVLPGVQVQNIDPSLHLQRMTYYLQDPETIGVPNTGSGQMAATGDPRSGCAIPTG
jgi:redox-sensing transcriptional repressor